VYLVYSFLLVLVFLIVIPAYFVKLRILKKESLHLAERLGFKVPARTTSRPFLWIHAVSVGEVLSLQNLIGEIKGAHPDWEIGFSTLTNTGYKVAAAKLKDVDRLFFVPLDFGRPVRRFFKRLRPYLLVLVESEFWPRLLREARRFRCPVFLVNGRVSGRSFRRLRRFKWGARLLLKNIDRFLVQTAQDKERLEAVGVESGRVAVSGNLKCETRLPELGESEILGLRAELSIEDGKKVLVAGSIHRGEEEKLFAAFREARRRRNDILLVLAPRHPDKFLDIEKSFDGGNLIVCRKTRYETGRTWDVLILDTIGDLVRFYALSDAAFIGGSLIPRGGQNLLEPAYYGKPIYFGPHMDNFAALAQLFVNGGGARIVEKPEELADMFLWRDPQDLEERGRRAKELLNSLQGATGRTLAALEKFMVHDK
jgi:3-deoxy-D-manno-octulosonic-acid transferase